MLIKLFGNNALNCAFNWSELFSVVAKRTDSGSSLLEFIIIRLRENFIIFKNFVFIH